MTNKVGMISLGCPKNQVDGEIMLEKLNKSGFEIAQSIEAVSYTHLDVYKRQIYILLQC